MNIKEIKELIETVCQNGITELEVQRAGVRVRIRREVTAAPSATSATFTPSASASHVAQPAPLVKDGPATRLQPESSGVGIDEDLVVVRSPIVGTFYRASNPDAEPFVRLGDFVESGRVLCIIEAMKLMNEIESEASGEVVKIYLDNGEPVEFGQALFGIRPVKKA
jgi:acetyl-CoA carboxylase biotin carboxyl carrier protein